MADHPVNVIVTDDLKRSRLTVFFRYLLAIPHFIWLYLWGIVASVVMFIIWFATLLIGRSPSWAHNFTAGYLRYSVHVNAYASLMGNPFPRFSSNAPYPVTVEIAPPAAQRRLITFFRLLLAIPAFIMSYIFEIVLAIVSFIGWFVGLILGRWPASFRRVTTYCLQYSTQTSAYAMLLTQRYPVFEHAQGIDQLETSGRAGDVPLAPQDDAT